MSKFCQNCGNTLDDAAMFCANCGKPFEAARTVAAPEPPAQPQYAAPKPPVQPQQQYAAPTPQYATPQQPQQYNYQQQGGYAPAPKKSNGFQNFVKTKKPLIIGVAGVVVVAIVLIIIFSACGGNSPKGVVSKFIKSDLKFDYVTEDSLVFTNNFDNEDSWDVYKERAEKREKETKDSDKFDEMKKKNDNTSFEVKATNKMSETDLSNLKKGLKNTKTSNGDDRYKDVDKITEGQEVWVVFTTKDDDGKISLSTNCYRVVKCNGKWYIAA